MFRPGIQTIVYTDARYDSICASFYSTQVGIITLILSLMVFTLVVRETNAY